MREQDWYYEYEDAIKERDAALARVERLEAALRQYADKQNWWSSDYGDDGIWQDTWRPDKDCKHPEHGFERARAALEAQP